MGYHWKVPQWAEGLCGHFANRRSSDLQQPGKPVWYQFLLFHQLKYCNHGTKGTTQNIIKVDDNNTTIQYLNKTWGREGNILLRKNKSENKKHVKIANIGTESIKTIVGKNINIGSYEKHHRYQKNPAEAAGLTDLNVDPQTIPAVTQQQHNQQSSHCRHRKTLFAAASPRNHTHMLF